MHISSPFHRFRHLIVRRALRQTMPMLLATTLLGCGEGSPEAAGAGGTETDGFGTQTMTAGSGTGADEGVDDSSGASPPVPTEPDPGAGSQTLTASIEVRAGGDSSGPLQTEFIVSLDDADDMPVPDATVTVQFDGESQVLVPDLDSPGTYRASASGYAQVYGFDIERGSDRLTDVTLVGPSVHTITLDPDPAAVEQPATASWVPHTEPEVETNVFVLGLETNTTHSEGPTLDDGEHPLPAEAFPEPDDYFVRIERFTRRDLDGPAVGTVRLAIELATQAMP